MDSQRLVSILDLTVELQIKRAFPCSNSRKVTCHHGMVDGFPSHDVLITKFGSYETDGYERRAVIIDYEDSSSAQGWTFTWQGDRQEFAKGEVDLKRWQAGRYGSQHIKIVKSFSSIHIQQGSISF